MKVIVTRPCKFVSGILRVIFGIKKDQQTY